MKSSLYLPHSGRLIGPHYASALEEAEVKHRKEGRFEHATCAQSLLKALNDGNDIQAELAFQTFYKLTGGEYVLLAVYRNGKWIHTEDLECIN